MYQRSRIVVCLVLLAASAASNINAAELSFVLGTLVKPEGVNEGDTLPPGTLVQSGSDALVMVEHQWPSDIPGRACVLVAIFGYGESYTVSESGTPGRCDTTVPTDPAAFQPGQPFLSRETRYGDAKFDEPTVPAKVSASKAQWRTFDDWVANAQRTFTGVVTLVTGTRIRVRSPQSGNQRSFSVNPSTVDSPVALDTLIDKSVRLDYRMAGSGPEALRVQLTSPPSVAVGTDRKLVLPKVQVPQQPVEPVSPADSPAEPEDTGEVADQVVENWTCSIDLHQGDTGTLEFSRQDGKIRGAMIITRGEQSHAISGTWKRDSIEFWRALSESSGQPFTGVVTAAEDGAVRMAGRFAHEYRGLWSAECSPGQGRSGITTAPPSGTYDVVLRGFGENKIAVIKVVRAFTGLGLKDAKDAVESTPYTIKTGVSVDEAKRLASELQEAGALVTLEEVK